MGKKKPSSPQAAAPRKRAGKSPPRGDGRRAGQSLRDSEAWYRGLYEGVAGGVVVQDGRGTIIEANPAACEILGLTPDEVRGRTSVDPRWHAIHEDGSPFPGEDHPAMATLRSGRAVRDTVMGVFHPGAETYRWILINSQPILDSATGQVQAVVTTFLDITDRKQAQEALKKAHDELDHKVRERTEELHKANQTLRMISECNEVLVRLADEFELVKEICQIIVRLGGYRMAWVGYAEDDAEKTVQPIAAVGFEKGYLQHARTTWADTECGRGLTGTCIRTGQVGVGRDFATDPELAPWREEALARGYRSALALPLTACGKVFGALTLYADQAGFFDESQVAMLRELADDLAFGIVALRAQAERDNARQVAQRRAEQLQALAAELVHAEQAERRRLAQILHDHLQQLLVGAKFNVGTLRAKTKTKAQRQAVDQLAETLDEAIKASRSLTAELSPPVLHEKGLAAGLDWLGRQMHEKHGLTVEVHADADAEPAAEQLRVFLFEAVRELLFNVVKHAGADRAEVRLCRLDDREVTITVADEGAGFDPARLEEGGRSVGGFGLFSIRERLSYLGGRLEVESAPGRGSRFTLVAPLTLPDALRPKEAAPAAEGVPGRAGAAAPGAGVRLGDGRKIRVLLADDHTVMRQGLVALLQAEPDIEVVGEAADGMEAVALARELRPDVVIMDVNMPRLGGEEATRALLAERPELRVIALSLYDPADMAPSMRQAGAGAYLHKAGPADALLAAVRGP
jgi:PAS domain S-box-containing protein